MERIAVIDFETTGITPSSHCRATEIAVVILERGQIVQPKRMDIVRIVEALDQLAKAILADRELAEQVNRLARGLDRWRQSLCQQLGVLEAETPARARDDRDLAVKTDVSHGAER